MTTGDSDALSWLLALAPGVAGALKDLFPDVDGRRRAAEDLRRLALAGRYPHLLREAVLAAASSTEEAVGQCQDAEVEYEAREIFYNCARRDYLLALRSRWETLTIGTRALTPGENEEARGIEGALEGTGIDVGQMGSASSTSATTSQSTPAPAPLGSAAARSSTPASTSSCVPVNVDSSAARSGDSPSREAATAPSSPAPVHDEIPGASAASSPVPAGEHVLALKDFDILLDGTKFYRIRPQGDHRRILLEALLEADTLPISVERLVKHTAVDRRSVSSIMLDLIDRLADKAGYPILISDGKGLYGLAPGIRRADPPTTGVR